MLENPSGKKGQILSMVYNLLHNMGLYMVFAINQKLINLKASFMVTKFKRRHDACHATWDAGMEGGIYQLPCLFLVLTGVR